MMETAPWILGGIIAAGILHILTVFGVPWLAEKDAWSRIVSHYPSNTLSIDQQSEMPTLPFMSPDVIVAFCPFDISERNVAITAALADNPWSIAVSTRSGENFYLITGADTKRAKARILIIPKDRLAQEASTEKTDEGADQNIIVSPTTTGIVAIRAPIIGESFRGQTVELLKQARCEVQKPTEPIIASVTDDKVETTSKPSVAPQKDKRRRQRRAERNE